MHRESFNNFSSEAAQFKREAKYERPKKPWEKLHDTMANISVQINQEAQEKFGLQNLVDSEGQIQIQGYEDLYGTNDIKKCEQRVHECEVYFSGADKESRQEYFKTQFGIEGEQAIINKSQQERKKQKSFQMELAVTALLYKVLNDRYMVVRTSKFDDYVNGADNIIIDKQTGTVVCAFDEGHDYGDGKTTKKKISNVFDTAKNGGAKIHFGLAMEDGQLKRTQLKNLPAFFLGLDTEHLDDLISDMTSNESSELTKVEQQIFELLMQSIDKQIDGIKQQENVPQAVIDNLNKFKESFAGMPRFN